MVKNPPANAGDSRDMGLIPGSGRSSGEENGNPLRSSILAWEIPWTEELEDYSPWGYKESDMTERVCTHTYTCTHCYHTIPYKQMLIYSIKKSQKQKKKINKIKSST